MEEYIKVKDNVRKASTKLSKLINHNQEALYKIETATCITNEDLKVLGSVLLNILPSIEALIINLTNITKLQSIYSSIITLLIFTRIVIPESIKLNYQKSSNKKYNKKPKEHKTTKAEKIVIDNTITKLRSTNIFTDSFISANLKSIFKNKFVENPEYFAIAVDNTELVLSSTVKAQAILIIKEIENELTFELDKYKDIANIYVNGQKLNSSYYIRLFTKKMIGLQKIAKYFGVKIII
jgi:hypothetical protein